MRWRTSLGIHQENIKLRRHDNRRVAALTIRIGVGFA
jgi:hypothetical protein